jgi:Domain of unknown function (DUF4407)
MAIIRGSLLVGNPLIWLSGAQRDILARCRSDRPKYIGVGSAILITSAMAAVSMTFALYSALRVPLAASVVFAIAWGLAIMSLDRWLVVSLVRQPRKLNYLLLALPRVALGVLFGLIISTPFTLQIFKPEIDQQLAVIQKQNADQFYAGVSGDPLTKKISQDQTLVNNYEGIIRQNGQTGANLAQNPAVMALTEQRDQAASKASTAQNAYHCELYGTEMNGSGHCVQGNGPAAQQDQQEYNREESLVGSLDAQISSLETQIISSNAAAASSNLSNAKKDLGPAKAQLLSDQSEQKAEITSFTTTNAADTGLLQRLKALDQVTAKNGMLQTARWLLFLFFTVIECLPILVKVLLNLGPENTYEKALAQAERVSLRLAGQETTRQYRAAILAGDAVSSEAERLHSQWENDILPDIIRDTTEARERVARARLRRWEKAEMERPDGGYSEDWTGPGGLSRTRMLPETDWTSSAGPSMNGPAPRLRAAWQAFWGTGSGPDHAPPFQARSHDPEFPQ